MAPVTSTVRGIPSEVVLSAADGMSRECAINCDHIQTVSKAKVGSAITTMSAARMAEVTRSDSFRAGPVICAATSRAQQVARADDARRHVACRGQAPRRSPAAQPHRWLPSHREVLVSTRFALRFGKSYRRTCHRWASSASVVRLRPLWLGITFVLPVLLLRASASGEEASKAQAVWGVAVGLPQMVALTVEGPTSWPVRAHVHAGGVPALGWSLGLRVIVDPIRWRDPLPTAFWVLGTGASPERGRALHRSTTAHSGGVGVGLRLRIWRLTLSGDLGGIVLADGLWL